MRPDQSQGDLETAWEKSLEVRKADIVLVLYTGEGRLGARRGPGVCHAEFQQAGTMAGGSRWCASAAWHGAR